MTATFAASPAAAGLRAFPPVRAAAFRRTLVPAAVGLLAHTLTLIAFVAGRASGATSTIAPSTLIVDAAPSALTVGLLAAVATIVARRIRRTLLASGTKANTGQPIVTADAERRFHTHLATGQRAVTFPVPSDHRSRSGEFTRPIVVSAPSGHPRQPAQSTRAYPANRG